MKTNPDLWLIKCYNWRNTEEQIISGKKNYMSGPEFLSKKILKDDLL